MLGQTRAHNRETEIAAGGVDAASRPTVEVESISPSTEGISEALPTSPNIRVPEKSVRITEVWAISILVPRLVPPHIQRRLFG
jgi:hypothetical protein